MTATGWTETFERDVYMALRNRSGLNCRIVEGDTGRPGDRVEAA